MSSDEEDIIDEALKYFKANVFFNTFEMKGNADRLLVYLTLFTHQCVLRLSKVRTEWTAEKDAKKAQRRWAAGGHWWPLVAPRPFFVSSLPSFIPRAVVPLTPNGYPCHMTRAGHIAGRCQARDVHPLHRKLFCKPSPPVVHAASSPSPRLLSLVATTTALTPHTCPCPAAARGRLLPAALLLPEDHREVQGRCVRCHCAAPLPARRRVCCPRLCADAFLGTDTRPTDKLRDYLKQARQELSSRLAEICCDASGKPSKVSQRRAARRVLRVPPRGLFLAPACVALAMALPLRHAPPRHGLIPALCVFPRQWWTCFKTRKFLGKALEGPGSR